MDYYIYNTGNTFAWPAGSNATELPTDWTPGYTDYNHANSGYIAFKACTSGTNKDGTNRCGQADYVWIGADNIKPTAEMGTSNTGNGYNMNHYWATSTYGRSGAKVKWVDTSTNYNGSGCLNAYDNRITTQLAIDTPTPGGSWVWNAKYRVTAFYNDSDGNYNWSSRSTIMTKDVESYVCTGMGSGCGIWQRMISYSQSGVPAASHTKWC